jgi:ribonucleoside-diphosphate reductase alpha chain
MVQFTNNNIRTLEKRYLLKDESGKIIETPDELLIRVANTVCGNNESLKIKILEIMNDLRFLPNTPTLMNAGTTNMLSACFVISVEDNLESIIHDAGWQQAKIHKTGGGVGLNFSNLRPEGDLIKTTGGITSGVIGFLEVFNVLSEIIRQGGKRDGANMALLDISHPEIEKWINAKTGDNSKKFRNFNLSILITDNFMKCVEENLDWNLEFDGKIYNIVKARYLFDLICKSAWTSGCPGMIFVDEINRTNPYKDIMRIDSTNPCGEQPLYIGKYKNEKISESCNLGSINLSKYIISQLEFDYDKFRKDISTTVEFLDLVIDVNQYPFDFIDKGTKLTRKIGLGITGLSECLIKMDMIYGSDESLNFIETVMEILQTESHNVSYKLSKEKGTYPLYNEVNTDISYNRRNLFTTTIAPTGSIGRFMLGHPYSSGIEPPPAINMYSNIIDTTIDDGIHPLLIKMLKDTIDKKTFDIIIDKLNKDGKSIQIINEIPTRIKQLFLIAEEISIETHIKVQSLIQKYVDNAVSKTINMQNSATIKDVYKCFMLAWKSKCKGVTIYRDNSKDTQVFNSKKETIFTSTSLDDISPRPSILGALSFTKKTACNTLFIHPTYLYENSALEGFMNANGGCTAMRTGLAKCISLYQRILENISSEYAIRALNIVMTDLQDIPCQVCKDQMLREKHDIEKGKMIKHPVDSISCPSAVATVMKFMLEHKIETTIDGIPLKFNKTILNKNSYTTLLQNNIKIDIQSDELIKCPNCGSKTFRTEGCMNNKCIICDWGGCV